MADVIQKDISTFIENQFPSFYLEEGPVFVAFVKEYYKWLESKTPAAVSKLSGQWVSITASNSTLTGSNTHFDEDFSPGEALAVYRTETDYDVFTINTVANSTSLVLDEPLPSFSNTKTFVAPVALRSNPVYDSRRILEYMDVDQTIDEYIVHFKNKYLSGIQFDTNTNIRQLLKHTLDLYRAKGTPQALELLFRIVFGVEIDIYYPGDDVFRLSDGEWFTPRYIEIALSNVSEKLVNKQIIGTISGAKAFVDRAVRRKIRGRLIDVLYVSAISGTFIDGELLDYSGDIRLQPEERPVILGSLTTIDVDLNSAGENFAIGDLVNVTSPTGAEAVARVVSIANNSGIVRFNLDDGGFGYEPDGNTRILISEKVLKFSNVIVDRASNPWIKNYVELFETIEQPLANVAFVSSNGIFLPETNVYFYDSNNDVSGFGHILSVSTRNSESGSLLIAPVSGDLTTGQFFTYGNAIAANVSAIGGYTSINATGNVIGIADNLTLTYNSLIDASPGSRIMQKNGLGIELARGLVTESIHSPAGTILSVANTRGIFDIGGTLSSNGTILGTVTDVSFSVGVIDISNNFTSQVGNYVQAHTSNTWAVVDQVSAGSGASVEISDTLVNVDNVSIDVSMLDDYADVELGATTYGIPDHATTNATSGYLADILDPIDVSVGSIDSLVNVNAGQGYTAPPLIKVIDDRIAAYNHKDFIFTVTTPRALTPGEIVTQEATDAKGKVVSYSNSIMRVENLRFDSAHDFVLTTNSTTQIVSTNTSTVANVTSIERDSGSITGDNAEITVGLAVANGSIASLEVIETGFGFVTDQVVTLTSNTGLTANGFAQCSTIGTGKGFYRKKGGFPSDSKKLHDGFYYQDFSYDVLSSVTLDKYAEMLRDITHVAGTKNFARLVTVTAIDSASSFLPSEITIS